MPALIPIAISIGSAIATAAVVVATVVASIAVAVGTALATVGLFIASTVAAVVGGAVTAVMWAGSAIVSGLSVAYNAVMVTGLTVGKGIWVFSKALVSGMKLFLQAIHFKTVLKIHQIAMIFSKDYRNMMQNVYGEIAKVSEALGLGAQFLNLVLNDARNVVMSTSSLLGRSYDLGEVQWLGTMNDFLKGWSNDMEVFKNDPGRVFLEIGDWIHSPAIDAKASAQQTILTVLDGVVTVADATAEKVVTLREDLEQTILHLPPAISLDIYDKINPIFEGFDNFIENEYKPVARDISNAINVLTDTTVRQTDKLSALTNSILNPGDLLGNIDNLSELERIRQEGKISEIANRSSLRAVKEVNAKIDIAHKGLKEIYDAITEVREKPPYHVSEVAGLQYKPGAIPKPYISWFVGDF